MLHQKKKQLYFSLVLIYTVNNQLPQKVFFNENSGCIFRLEQNATRNFRTFAIFEIRQSNRLGLSYFVYGHF